MSDFSTFADGDDCRECLEYEREVKGFAKQALEKEKRIAELEAQVSMSKEVMQAWRDNKAALTPAEPFTGAFNKLVSLTRAGLSMLTPGSMKCVEAWAPYYFADKAISVDDIAEAEDDPVIDHEVRTGVAKKVKLWCFYREE